MQPIALFPDRRNAHAPPAEDRAASSERAAPVEMPTPATPVALIEAAVAELHHVALSVAVVTSAINSMKDWRARLSADEIARRLPRTISLARVLSLLESDAVDHSALTAPTSVVVTELQKCVLALGEFFDDATTIGAARAGTLHARRLGDQWRPICRSLSDIVLAWQQASPPTLPELYAQNTRILSALLLGAAAGFRPCLDDDGALYAPELPQMRRWPRRYVLQSCLVMTDNFLLEAVVRDASAGGLGLDQVHGVQPGDVLAVELQSGRRFHGVVAWSKYGKAGLRFDIPLPDDDPLIAE
ncbi:MAG: PilZ domain-containing protein [Hyphomicrobium sp.]|nr:PilZ domain-containing protein [Hyphomicrobium sp.]